jgi:hypothetical protein
MNGLFSSPYWALRTSIIKTEHKWTHNQIFTIHRTPIKLQVVSCLINKSHLKYQNEFYIGVK